MTKPFVPTPEPEDKIRPIELDDAPTGNVFTQEPEDKIRPIELETAPVDHGVEIEGMGRGFSTQRMGRNKQADAYATAKKRAIKSVAEALRLFKLDWKVGLQTLQTEMGQAVTDHKAVIRLDTGDVLGVVGSRYTPIQNDVLEILDAITDEAPIVRGGVWDGGRRVWLQTEVTEWETPSGPVKGNGLAATSHDGSLAITFTSLGVVVVCRNTFAMNLANSPNKFTIKHTARAADMIAAARENLQNSKAYFKTLKQEFGTWGRKRVTDADRWRILEMLAPKPEKLEGKAKTAYADKLEKLDYAYKHAPGAMPGTAWGLGMAVTYYQQHMRAVRTGTDRFERAVNDPLTQQALQTVSLIAHGG